jgi:hypothetical protein
MSRGEGHRGRHLQDFHLIKAPIKFFEKIFQKPLDKLHKMWYNKYVIRVATKRHKERKYTYEVQCCS